LAVAHNSQSASRAEDELTPSSQKGNENMALSDQLSRLAARTKELEDRAAASKQMAKSELESQVQAARDASQAQSEALRKRTEQDKEQISSWWTNVGRSWNEHIAATHQSIDDRRAERDLKSAQRAADRADDDAAYAVDYAYAAVEEAEYAILDAALAHQRAEELAATLAAS
jgi:hypothetical protein